MYALWLVVMLLVAYLFGSLNFAVIVARLVGGRDIRALGSGNPGAANVFREIGKGWGLLVGLLDALKSFLPILVARLLLFRADNYADFWALFLIGMAAATGHIKPLFYGFKGGGGLSTVLGLFVFFLPFEYLVSLVLGGLIVIRFFKGMQYKFGRWTPIMSVVITPILTLSLNYLVYVPLFAHLSIGGHPWYILVGAFAVSLFMLGMNIPFLLERFSEQRRKPDS
jgi:glycerol-3-phosphate acyltransferase PlsY